MSGVSADLRAIGAGLRSRVVFAAQQARRATPGPALVRLATTVAALSALALALPAQALDSWVPLLVPVATGVGLFPRTRWVSVVALLAVGAWLVTTIAFEEPVVPWRVAALASALYLMHVGAALAAVLPYDCIVAPGALLRWAAGGAVVLGASLALGLGGMAAAGQLPGERSVVGPIVGSAVAAGLAGLLAWHLRRR